MRQVTIFLDYRLDEQEITEIWKHISKLSWWQSMTIEDFKQSVKSSICNVATVFEDNKNKIIGYIRVFTDYCQLCYYDDLVINPEYRGLKAGKALMAAVRANENTKYARRHLLLAGHGVSELHKSLGFNEIKDNKHYIAMDDIYESNKAQDYLDSLSHIVIDDGGCNGF